jgi:hypothetical protein
MDFSRWYSSLIADCEFDAFFRYLRRFRHVGASEVDAQETRLELRVGQRVIEPALRMPPPPRRAVRVARAC